MKECPSCLQPLNSIASLIVPLVAFMTWKASIPSEVNYRRIAGTVASPTPIVPTAILRAAAEYQHEPNRVRFRRLHFPMVGM
jgi:hypothetical protein